MGEKVEFLRNPSFLYSTNWLSMFSAELPSERDKEIWTKFKSSKMI